MGGLGGSPPRIRRNFENHQWIRSNLGAVRADCPNEISNCPLPPTHTQTSRTPMIKLADEVLARRTDGQIIGRLMQNIPMLRVSAAPSIVTCWNVSTMQKDSFFSTCIVQSARTSKLLALHFEKSDRGDSLHEVDCVSQIAPAASNTPETCAIQIN